MAEVLQAQCAEVGVTLDIQVLEGGALDEILLGGTSQLTLYGQSATTFEGGRPLQHFLPDNKGLSAAAQNDIGGFELTRSYEQHYLQYVYFK